MTRSCYPREYPGSRDACAGEARAGDVGAGSSSVGRAT